MHPGGTIGAGPDDVIGRERIGQRHAIDVLGRTDGDRVLGAVLETQQVPRRVLGRVVGREAGLGPAQMGNVAGGAGELTYGVEGDLRIVGASLDGEVAAGAGRFELVAVELGQVDQRVRAARGQAVAIVPVFC